MNKGIVESNCKALREYCIRNGRPSLVLADDHSLMGGSDDMKLSVEIVDF